MKETKENPLGTEKVGSLLLKFAVPSIIAMLVSSLYNIVDQFFIGQSVGVYGNAATNVAFPLSITCTALSLLCGIGGAANFNLAMGRGKKEEAASFAGGALGMMVILGTVLCAVSRIFLEPMMVAFGATDKVLEYALTYTGITSLGFPFLIFTTGGSNLVRADGSPRFSMVCTLTGAVINTILDPILIFKFHMGMAGAAWATVAGQVISAAMVFFYLTRFRTVELKLSLLIPKARIWKAILSLGVSPFCNQIAIMVVQILMNNLLKYYGGQSSYGSEIPLACAGIISKVNMIFFAVVIGIAQGIQPIIGFNYGAGNFGRVRETYRKAVGAAVAVSTVAFFLFQTVRDRLLRSSGTGTAPILILRKNFSGSICFLLFLMEFNRLHPTFLPPSEKRGKGCFFL